MRRADRIFQFVQYLRNRRLTTAARLAEHQEVSERTIYRKNGGEYGNCPNSTWGSAKDVYILSMN